MKIKKPTPLPQHNQLEQGSSLLFFYPFVHASVLQHPERKMLPILALMQFDNYTLLHHIQVTDTMARGKALSFRYWQLALLYDANQKMINETIALEIVHPNHIKENRAILCRYYDQIMQLPPGYIANLLDVDNTTISRYRKAYRNKDIHMGWKTAYHPVLRRYVLQ
jgi:hypothetical protein